MASHLLIAFGGVDQTNRGSSDWQCTFGTLMAKYLLNKVNKRGKGLLD